MEQSLPCNQGGLGKKVSDEDVVLMPGDFSWAIKSEDAESDFALFKELKGKKVILRGNHDFGGTR